MNLPLDRLRAQDPFLHRHLDCPGGFESQAIMGQYNETRSRLALLEGINRFDRGFGKGVGIAGPVQALEKLLRSGLLSAFPETLLFSAEIREAIDIETFAERQATVLPLNGDRPALRGMVCLAPCNIDIETVLVPPDPVCHPMEQEDLAGFKRRRLAYISNRIARVFRPGRTVLFMAKIEYFQQMRISSVLRRQGMTTIFVALSNNVTRGKEGFFDLVLDASGNYDIFYEVPNLFDFDVVHVQAWMNDHHVAAAAALLSRNPVIAHLNDLPMLFLEPEDYDMVFGSGGFAREMESIKRLLAHASGLVVNTELKATKKAFEGLIRETPPMIGFHCYPLREFFADEPEYDPLSLVSAGTVIPSNFPMAAFGDACILELARRYIVPQGLDFHVYCNPVNQDRNSPQLWDHRVYDDIEPRFHLHDGLPPERLVPRLAAYGMGSMCYLFDGVRVKPEHLAAIMPTKAFTYAEAGLPVLLSSRFEALCEWLGSYGACVSVTDEDLKSGLRKLLDRQDHEQLRRGMRHFREENSMDRRITDLLELCSEAVERHAGIRST